MPRRDLVRAKGLVFALVALVTWLDYQPASRRLVGHYSCPAGTSSPPGDHNVLGGWRSGDRGGLFRPLRTAVLRHRRRSCAHRGVSSAIGLLFVVLILSNFLRTFPAAGSADRHLQVDPFSAARKSGRTIMLVVTPARPGSLRGVLAFAPTPAAAIGGRLFSWFPAPRRPINLNDSCRCPTSPGHRQCHQMIGGAPG